MNNMNNINNTNTFAASALPRMAMEIPAVNDSAATITALVKDGSKVTGYKLSDGQILDKPQAVALARSGGIAGVGISERYGSEYLKSIPDGTDNNNLSHLPTVSN